MFSSQQCCHSGSKLHAGRSVSFIYRPDTNLTNQTDSFIPGASSHSEDEQSKPVITNCFILSEPGGQIPQKKSDQSRPSSVSQEIPK